MSGTICSFDLDLKGNKMLTGFSFSGELFFQTVGDTRQIVKYSNVK